MFLRKRLSSLTSSLPKASLPKANRLAAKRQAVQCAAMARGKGRTRHRGVLAFAPGHGRSQPMTMRTRKLIGTVAMVCFVSIYVLFAMAVTAVYLPGSHWVVQVIGYMIAGLLWVLPAGALISWMSKPDR